MIHLCAPPGSALALKCNLLYKTENVVSDVDIWIFGKTNLMLSSSANFPADDIGE